MANSETRTGIEMFHGEAELFRHVDPDDYMWTGEGDRSIQKTIEFGRELPGDPHILTTVTALDASHAQNLRYRLEVVDTTRHAFACRLSTWGDTRIAGVTISWLALCASDDSPGVEQPVRPDPGGSVANPSVQAGADPADPAEKTKKAKQARRARRAARRQDLRPDR